MPGFLNLCGIQHFAGTKMLEEGRFCHARGGAHGQKSGKTQNKDICKADVLILWKGWLKSIFWGACYEADKRGGTVPPAFWPAARVRRTSVLPQAKPRRRGGSAAPSIEIPKGRAALRAAEPKTKGHPFGCPFVLVREAGVEPARPCEHWHLKPASLPIPPLAQVGRSLCINRNEQYLTTERGRCQLILKKVFAKIFCPLLTNGRKLCRIESRC